jgi:hypothetical protein
MAKIEESPVLGFREVELMAWPPTNQSALVCEVCWAMVPLDAEAAGRHLGWHEDRGEM